jgi:hypothetical protein
MADMFNVFSDNSIPCVADRRARTVAKLVLNAQGEAVLCNYEALPSASLFYLTRLLVQARTYFCTVNTWASVA